MFIAASLTFPTASSNRPPIVLVHGAANSALVWKFWQQELAARGWPSYAVDLRGHGNSEPVDLSSTRMQDYAVDVQAIAAQIRQPPVIVGWSMGGLVAMMAAATGTYMACVALAPSVPAWRKDTSIELRNGVFGPEEYGITSQNPDDQPKMPDLNQEERGIALASASSESRLARDERRRGIVIEEMPCPLLIVTGELDTAWPSERYEGLWLRPDHFTIKGASHWGLVLNRRALAVVIPRVLEWLENF